MAKGKNPLFEVLKAPRHHYDPKEIVTLFAQVDEARVRSLAASLAIYIGKNLPAAIEKRDGLSDYRTNPYVLMTSANVMRLSDPARFADFLFNNKLYMGLETSFGKSIEAAFVAEYPLHSSAAHHWIDPPEKVAEAAELVGLSNQDKAVRRVDSVWREIDKSCVIGDRRYVVSIKSGPNTINDTQVAEMARAILANHPTWFKKTRETYPAVRHLEVAIGLTYGTDRTTNNKENQILAKLLGKGFVEEDRNGSPGVLIDKKHRSVRVYRRIGRDFWSLIGNPEDPPRASFVFLEVLLALTKALSDAMAAADLETRINAKILALSEALRGLMLPRKILPSWVRDDLSESELFWFMSAMTAFYDEGI